MIFAHDGGSDNKESVCSVGDLGSIPGLGRLPGEGNGYPPQYSCLENSLDRGGWRAIVSVVVKNLPANAGDEGNMGSVPGSGRSPGVGNCNPLQYACLENSMDRGDWWATVHGVAKSQTWLNVHTLLLCSWWWRWNEERVLIIELRFLFYFIFFRIEILKKF